MVWEDYGNDGPIIEGPLQKFHGNRNTADTMKFQTATNSIGMNSPVLLAVQYEGPTTTRSKVDRNDGALRL